MLASFLRLIPAWPAAYFGALTGVKIIQVVSEMRRRLSELSHEARSENLHARPVLIAVRQLVEAMPGLFDAPNTRLGHAFPAWPLCYLLQVPLNTLGKDYVVVLRVNELHGNCWF
mmetsp:Transcript_18982/g.35604  ORF Transcript_18982/g.35604 Transcript_18982/m.35604 type:complete len:115 (-) Transcript_18982:1119-1463(-)